MIETDRVTILPIIARKLMTLLKYQARTELTSNKQTKPLQKMSYVSMTLLKRTQTTHTEGMPHHLTCIPKIPMAAEKDEVRG